MWKYRMGGVSCEKPKKKHRKGLWSPDEDQRLRDYVLTHGHASWTSVPINAGLQRNGKSCRLRWINHLRPGLKRGAFSIVEEETILTLHKILGNKWSQIAHHLPGRTDNEVKNYWHSYLKKRVAKSEHHSRQGQIQSSTSSTHTPSLQSHQTELSLPKVLFAEWLSFDHQDSCKNVIDTHTHTSNLGDTSIDHGTFGVVKDMLPLPFNIPLDYYSPQDFTIYHDVYTPINTF